jgi:uncharacterized protein (DUF1919 family)
MKARKIADRAMLQPLALRARRDRRRLRSREFSLVANDCWGAEAYRHLGLAYTSPFVGLFLPAPDFVTMLGDLRRWVLDEPFAWVSESRHPIYAGAAYPIGVLGGEIEVHFVHHADRHVAEASWRRRSARMNWDHLCVKMGADKDLCTPQLVEAFDALPIARKVCLTRRRYAARSAIAVPGYCNDGAVLFRYSVWRFDLPRWLETGRLGL